MKLLKTDIENEKNEINFKIKEKHVAGIFFSVCLLKWLPQWSTEVREELEPGHKTS